MTNIADSVEREYRSINESLPSRKNSALFFGVVATAVYLGGAVLLRFCPEIFHAPKEELANINTIEYVKTVASTYPVFITPPLVIGATSPEIYHGFSYLFFKPVKLVGRGIDYLVNRYMHKT